MRARWLTVLTAASLVAVAAAFLLRIPSIAEPLGIDQSLWASAVRGMSHGQRLYRDVWEQRPPGIYWIYLAAFRTIGWTPAAVAWLDIVASAALTLLLFAVGSRLASRLTGAVIAALYATLTMPAWLYGHGGLLERSVCETFIVACVGFGAWCALAVRDRQSITGAIGLGLSAGAAVILKPNAGLYFPALLLWIGLYSALPRKQLVRPIIVAMAASTVVPLAALLWLWRLDLLHDARVAVVDFNRYYVSQGFSLTSYVNVFAHALFLRMKTDPLWLAGTVGSIVAVWDLARGRRLPPLAGLGVIWGAAAALVIVVNGRFLFNSYFMNALPPMAIMGAWLLVDAAAETRPRAAVAAVIGVAMAVLLVQRGYIPRVVGSARLNLAALRGRIDRTTYLEQFGGYGNGRGYSARANEELADYVRAHTTPDERVFLFGINGAGVYFAADRLTANRFLRANDFVETTFPDPAFRLDAVVADLAAARPRYLIFEKLNTGTQMARAVDTLPADPAIAPLLRDYAPDAVIEDFSLYRRVD
jgi:4-amino-4-deoxy-L-arabinose transferase-like glycosyltransferase